MEYNEFIKNKEVIAKETGFEISKEELNQNLFEFQKDIVRWALIKSDINLISLCQICHAKVHRGKESKELNHKLRLQFQNKLEILLDKEYLTEKEINDVLKISQTALRGLLKTLVVYKEGYKREDVIRACMGGRIIE